MKTRSRFTAFTVALLGAFLCFGSLILSGCADGALTEQDAEALEQTPRSSKMRHAHLFGSSDGAGKIINRYEDLITETEFIVRIDDVVLDMNGIVSRYNDEEGVTIKHSYREVYKGFAMHVNKAHVGRLLDILDGDDDIAWVEPDPKIRKNPSQRFIQTGPPRQFLPWGIDRIGGPQSSAASGNGSGRVDVDLYVMDTGVRDKDIDLVEAITFVGGNTRDGLGHGTHIAGTAAAEDDRDGVVGIAPGARVHNLKVLNGNGQTDLSTVIAAVEYVTEQKAAAPSTPMVVNMSFGADVGTSAYNALDEAIVSSIEQGVVYVIAAGNEGIDASTITPAHVEEAITVGAYDQDDVFCGFSNYGPAVDLLAPGQDIVSTENHDNPKFLNRMGGTSMAAPHAAGAAALYLSQNPSATPQQVRDALVNAGRAWVSGTSAGTTNLSVYVGDF